jgi:hypothetical protein
MTATRKKQGGIPFTEKDARLFQDVSCPCTVSLSKEHTLTFEMSFGKHGGIKAM